MNPHLCRIVLRPRGPLEVFDLSVGYVRTRFGAFLRMSALLLLPVWLAACGAAWLTDGHWGVLVVTWVLALALRPPFTMLAGRLLFADEVSVWRVLADLGRLIPSLLSTWAVRVGGVLLAALTCFVALPWTQGALCYLDEAALLERVAPGRAIRRSTHLASQQVGNAIVGVAGSWALDLWLALLGESVGQALIGFVLQLGAPFGALWSGQVTPYLLGGLLASVPLVAVFRLLLYVDVRTRVEGWDLQVGLRAAGIAT